MRTRPPELPFIITIPTLQRLIGHGWSTRRIRRWLGRMGCLEKRGGVVFTTVERLCTEFPELHRRLIEQESLDDEEDP